MKRGGGTDGSVALPPPPLEWKFSQVFGERLAGEEIQEGMIDLQFLQLNGELRTGYLSFSIFGLVYGHLYNFNGICMVECWRVNVDRELS